MIRGLFDEPAQVLAGPSPPSPDAARLLQGRGDEVVLSARSSLRYCSEPAARHLVERRLRDEEMAAVD